MKSWDARRRLYAKTPKKPPCSSCRLIFRLTRHLGSSIILTSDNSLLWMWVFNTPDRYTTHTHRMGTTAEVCTRWLKVPTRVKSASVHFPLIHQHRSFWLAAQQKPQCERAFRERRRSAKISQWIHRQNRAVICNVSSLKLLSLIVSLTSDGAFGLWTAAQVQFEPLWVLRSYSGHSSLPSDIIIHKIV